MSSVAAMLAACACALLLHCAADADEALEWHDATALRVEGKAWADTESFFDRLPARALSQVNDDLKGLAKLSTGMAIRFATDTDTLRVRWSLGDQTYVMTHMAATGTSGLDLYAKAADGRWAYMGTGRPEDKRDNEWVVFANRPKVERTFLLYLPLFNRVTALSIGLTPGSALKVVPSGRGKTVVFYGTSIVNGGCASRPGMAYPAIIGRKLDVPTINLGFSGNGQMHPPVVDLLAELDAAAYVIDCCPNMSPDLVTERTAPLVRRLWQAHPDTPIVLVENIEYQASAFLTGTRTGHQAKNAAFRAQYEGLVAEGVKGLTYVEGDPLFGDDGEATVDGTHATDLGFLRMAQALAPVLATALGR